MELEKIFESILREGWDEDLAAYNKASSRFDRQKRSIYGLASNEMNRLDKADGTTVTLDCGGYELEVAITPSIGRLRLNNHEFDNEEVAKMTADTVAGIVLEEVVEKYFKVKNMYTSTLQFNTKWPFKFIETFKSVMDAAPAVFEDIKNNIAKANDIYDKAKTAHNNRAKNIDAAMGNRSDKVTALHSKLTPDAYKAEHPFGVGTIVDGWTVKEINEADGTVKMVSPKGAIRNMDLETVKKNWESNIANREIPWNFPYHRKFEKE